MVSFGQSEHLIDDVTVCIPTIPPRSSLLLRAVKSVQAQTYPVESINIRTDVKKQGAAITRQSALDDVSTKWVAFLDDDDEFKPHHIEALLHHAHNESADYVYSWFDVVGGYDPFPSYHFTNPFNPEAPIQTTITVLVKTELAKEVGFDQPPGGATIHGQRWGEDYHFTLGCIRLGAKISHLVDRTWLWHHDSGNTSGLPDRW